MCECTLYHWNEKCFSFYSRIYLLWPKRFKRCDKYFLSAIRLSQTYWLLHFPKRFFIFSAHTNTIFCHLIYEKCVFLSFLFIHVDGFGRMKNYYKNPSRIGRIKHDRLCLLCGVYLLENKSYRIWFLCFVQTLPVEQKKAVEINLVHHLLKMLRLFSLRKFSLKHECVHNFWIFDWLSNA